MGSMEKILHHLQQSPNDADYDTVGPLSGAKFAGISDLVFQGLGSLGFR